VGSRYRGNAPRCGGPPLFSPVGRMKINCGGRRPSGPHPMDVYWVHVKIRVVRFFLGMSDLIMSA
jgi:hypothetical protein